MNNSEARLILSAHRPDGRDVADPAVVAAMAQAAADAELGAWWENEQRFDRAVASRLAQVAPPPGLRSAILAGTRAGHPRRGGWQWAVSLAVAAGVAVLMTVVTSPPRSAAPGAGVLAEFALRDLAESHDEHSARPDNLEEIQRRLASGPGSLRATVALDLDDLRRRNCRIVRVAGREVFELCFRRDGTWFHLYAARQSDFAEVGAASGPAYHVRGGLASSTWTHGGTVYALVTSGGMAGLRRAI